MAALKEQDDSYAGLVAYNRDPAWQFPSLRNFFPTHKGKITKEGVVEHKGLVYTHELLSYWPDHSVAVRQSDNSAKQIWVYLDGEVLCRATIISQVATPESPD